MKKDNTQTLNMDCMEYLKDVPDKYFDLAIVDPPYGIGVNKMTLGNGKRKVFRGTSDWDNYAPDSEYFDFLKRKSKNQIIWGANHFIDNIPFNLNSSCWIVWDKGTGDNDFADCELAWTSFDKTVKKYFQSWVGANAKEKNQISRIHPTQKPVKLYEWLLMNYAKEGDKILDTHLGSGSSRIAAYNLGFEFVGIELDKEYFEAQEKRFNQHISQLTLF
jgi:site-specific DNA-methyltransferase (adenine-specific)